MGKVIGMDLGDKRHVAVVFDENGEEIEAARITNTARQVQRFFGRYPGAVVVMEAGTHSGWIARLLEGQGHPVHVGNPRKLRAIWDADDKSDERDARVLALMYRLEPRLLHPVFHRGAQAQMDLAVVKSREQLVMCRSKLINHVRSVVKGTGHRLPSGGSRAFPHRAREAMPPELVEALEAVLCTIEQLTEQITRQDRLIERLSEERYPETRLLRQVPGVGAVTALAYVLTLEEPQRFEKSRSVGAFLGLVPKRDQSGDTDKQLRITKAGNTYLRQLLISCAHHMMGPFGAKSDLRHYGERIAARGGKNAKKRAVVAVARKLAVLLHRLWRDGSEYVPLRSLPAKAA
jgi:transposase